MKGFTKYPKKNKDMLVGETEKLSKIYEFRRNNNKFRTRYIDEDGYFYVRRKKGKVAGKVITPRRAYSKGKGFRAWFRELLRSLLVALLVICLTIVTGANLIYIPEAKGWTDDIVTFESTHNLSSGEPLEIKYVPHIAHRDLITKEDIAEYIEHLFQDKAKIALAIAKCESKLRADAIGDRSLNPSSYGVFQVRAFHNRPSIEDLLDAKKNIEFAYELSKQGTNWGHWSCFTQKDTSGTNVGKPYYIKHL